MTTLGTTADESHEPIVVFISHATDDRVWAEAVCHSLEEAGIRCWIAPRDVAPGSDWATEILRTIRGCACLVLVHSRYTGGSPTTVAEVREAHAYGRPIVTIGVDSAIVPDNLKLFLSGPHRLDGTRAPRHDRLRELVTAVRERIVETGAAGARVRRGTTPGHVGPYRLISLLGEGGFGEVWLAERREPHTQRVALKIIKAGMDTHAVIARFEQERQALAVMDHPHVAKVFDADATPQGRPYFVMEYVDGRPITDYCDGNRLTLKERLALMIPVCEAVQHAHTKAIIHRDLKPSNILVTTVDGRAVPKVIDFGVAKAISHTMTPRTLFTEQGVLLGTPEYMSPEQAAMGQTDVDTRTDVYSLGVVLYELLSGVLPFDSRDLRQAGLEAMLRTIREVDAPKPSTRIARLETRELAEAAAAPSPAAEGTTSEPTLPAGGERRRPVADVRAPAGLAMAVAAARRTDPRTLARTLKRELEWIPLKALDKNRSRRYASPLELAADIRAYLAARPLQAAPPSVAYRARKLFHQYRGPLLAVGATMLALALGLALALRATVTAREREAWALREARIGEISNKSLQEVLRAAGDPKHLEAVRAAADGVLSKRTAGATMDFKPLFRFRTGPVSLIDLSPDRDEAAVVTAADEAPPDPLTALFVMAIYSRTHRQFEPADRYYTECERVFAEVLGPGHWMLGATLGGHGAVLMEMGRFAEAESRMLRGHAILGSSLGDRHTLQRSVEFGLVWLYERWERPEDARVWRERASRPRNSSRR